MSFNYVYTVIYVGLVSLKWDEYCLSPCEYNWWTELVDDTKGYDSTVWVLTSVLSIYILFGYTYSPSGRLLELISLITTYLGLYVI